MSIRDVLIAAGILILVVVVADLIRRYLQRNKLRLAIDDNFKDFPAVDLSSELPNGGARAVVSKSAPSPLPSAALAPHTDTVKAKAGMSAEGDFGEPADREFQAESWVIDPILSGNREPDQEVDLLLEREFKGLGEGASRWMSQTETLSATKPSAAVDGLRSQDFDALEDAGDVSALDTPAKATDREVLATAAPLSAFTSSPASSPSSAEAESNTPKASLGLVADADLIDLERPVHELLQARQQAGLIRSTAENASSASTAEVEKETEKRVVPPKSDSVSAVNSAKQSSSSQASKASHAPKTEQQQELQQSFFDLDPDLAPAVEHAPPKPKSRRQRKKAQQQEAAAIVQDTPPETLLEEEVLIINVQAKRAPFSGPLLFKLVEACGLEFGDRDIYHRYEEANGREALQFSMANAVRPGTFDPAQQLPLSTPAVSFFLCLADPTERMNALECMLATAKCVADNLDGELKDENRSSLRTQTIEHYRQKVREFERKALTRRR